MPAATAAATAEKFALVSITPGLSYKDAPAAIAWLKKALGFKLATLHQSDDGEVHFAYLTWGNGGVQISTRQETGRLPQAGNVGIVLTAADVAAVDRHYAQAIAAGAEIALPVEDAPYGAHQFSVRDPEGNLWHISSPWMNSEAAQSMHDKRPVE